jgi:hypothetical protein
VKVVKSVVAVSPNDRKSGNDHDWDEYDAYNGSRGQNEPAVWTDLFHLFTGVERIVRIESFIYAVCRSVGDPGGKEGLEPC